MTDVAPSQDQDPNGPSGSVPRHLIHVEARIDHRTSPRHFHSIKNELRSVITTLGQLSCDSNIDPRHWSDSPLLESNLRAVRIADGPKYGEHIKTTHCILDIHLYQIAEEDNIEEFAATGAEDEEDGGISAASVTELPGSGLEGVWDTLMYEDDIKVKLLNFIETKMDFQAAGINSSLISCNGLVLLHGPPGTGKTTLCRALAQKLAIRMSDRYSHGKLVEINSHSLFSKWFSESGKLVQRLFSLINELVDDESGFVVVLIDEVESLTAARSSSSSEPSDAVRVVNAVLTQIDKLKARDNVLVVTTSNISEAIDPAFLDRADIKQYIGLPPQPAVYWILQTCFEELMQKGLVERLRLLTTQEVAYAAMGVMPMDGLEERARGLSVRLWDLAAVCVGLSGRSLRRLPFLAYTKLKRSGEVAAAAAAAATQVTMVNGSQDKDNRLSSQAGTIPLDKWISATLQSALDSKSELERALAGEGPANGLVSEDKVPAGNFSHRGR